MNEFIKPGEITGLICAKQTRAERLWARAIAIITYADPQPWSSLGQISNRQATAYILKRSGMPAWLIQSFMRLDEDEFAAAWRYAQEARIDPPLADWLDKLAAAMPSFNEGQCAQVARSAIAQTKEGA